MKFWFDTEFLDEPPSIWLISIGIVGEDGREYYAEVEDADGVLRMAGPKHWLIKNVVPHLRGPRKYYREVGKEIEQFVGRDPEFWAYCGAYDWLALSHLYGPLVERPKGWPFNHFDTNQLPRFREFVVTEGNKHNALDDARSLKLTWMRWRGANPTFPLPEPPEKPR